MFNARSLFVSTSHVRGCLERPELSCLNCTPKGTNLGKQSCVHETSMQPVARISEKWTRYGLLQVPNEETIPQRRQAHQSHPLDDCWLTFNPLYFGDSASSKLGFLGCSLPSLNICQKEAYSSFPTSAPCLLEWINPTCMIAAPTSELQWPKPDVLARWFLTHESH